MYLSYTLEDKLSVRQNLGEIQQNRLQVNEATQKKTNFGTLTYAVQ